LEKNPKGSSTGEGRHMLPLSLPGFLQTSLTLLWGIPKVIRPERGENHRVFD